VSTISTHLGRIVRRLFGERRMADRTGDAPGRRSSDRDPLYGWRPSLLIALTIAALDWGSKAAIHATIPLGGFREVIEGRLAFWHVRNPAMILGLWENLSLDNRKLLAALAAIVAAVVLLQIVGRAHRLPSAHRRWAWLFVGMVAGGMLGNLGERLIHWGVTDFISLRWGAYWLPPGNVADLALFLSIPLTVPLVVFELRERARRGSGQPGDGEGRETTEAAARA
jgi:lipoprotein signal peptidase